MRRTKAALIYRRTKNLRAVQLLLGHSKLESTVRYLGIEVDDALEISGQTEIWSNCTAGRPVVECNKAGRAAWLASPPRPRPTHRDVMAGRALDSGELPGTAGNWRSRLSADDGRARRPGRGLRVG